MKDGGPAFPQPNQIIDTASGKMEARKWMEDSGMTLRDWFAGQALAGLCALDDWGHDACSKRAVGAFEQADAMLKARDE